MVFVYPCICIPRGGGSARLHVCVCVLCASSLPMGRSAHLLPLLHLPHSSTPVLSSLARSKEGAVVGGDAFMAAVGDDLLDSIIGDHIPIYTEQVGRSAWAACCACM